MAKVYERKCIDHYEVTAQNGDHFQLVIGKTYTVSGRSPDGWLTVFSCFWVGVPADCFEDVPLAEPDPPTSQQKEQMFGDLLAVIHGDGGHYVEAHGWEKAAHDAEEIVCKLRQRIDGYEAWERSVNEALNSGDGSYRP